MASLYRRKLKSGWVWYGDVRLPDGRHKCFNTHCQDKRQAGKVLLAAQSEADADRNPFRPRISGQTITDLAESFLAERAAFLSAKTLQAYQDTLRRAERVLGAIPITSISKAEVIAFRESLSRMSPHSVNHYLRNLRVFLNWCATEALVPNWNPPKIEFVKAPASGHRDYYTSEECRRILEAAAGVRLSSIPFQVFLGLLILTGLRLGEALSLRWTWIDFDRAEIHIPPQATKSNRRRTIPLPRPARDLLATLPRQSRDIALFRFSSQSGHLRDVWRKVTRAAGVQYLKLHNLRDTFAVNMLLVGVPLPIVSQILGHASISTTIKHYAEFASEELAQASRKAEVFSTAILPASPKLLDFKEQHPDS